MRRCSKPSLLGIISALIVAWTATSPIDRRSRGSAAATSPPTRRRCQSALAQTSRRAGTSRSGRPEDQVRARQGRWLPHRDESPREDYDSAVGVPLLPDQTVEIETTGIDVSGLLQAGTGHSVPSEHPPEEQGDDHIYGTARPSLGGPHEGNRGPEGGRLQLYGARGVPGGTPDGSQLDPSERGGGAAGQVRHGHRDRKHNIGRPVPGNGATTLQLAKDVATGAGAWQDGDWIAVATTSLQPVRDGVRPDQRASLERRGRQHGHP